MYFPRRSITTQNNTTDFYESWPAKMNAMIGIVALVLAFTTLGVMAGAEWGIVAAVVGVVVLGTAALGMCPAYMPLKISTCKVASR